MSELKGKARADLRNEQIKRLLSAWETRRDNLCDEVAFKKGQIELLEEHIKFAYQSIVDVNKEEGDKERMRLTTKVKEIQNTDETKKSHKKRITKKR